MMMATANDDTGPVSKVFKLPPLFPLDVVREAFRGLRHPETVRIDMQRLGAMEGRGLVKPDVLQDHYPRIYRECCRILVERDTEKGAA